jgi:hypothetical protein
MWYARWWVTKGAESFQNRREIFGIVKTTEAVQGICDIELLSSLLSLRLS